MLWRPSLGMLLEEHPLPAGLRGRTGPGTQKKRGGANMGEMFSGNPVGVTIPLTIRLNVFICGCCPGPGHPYLSTPREEALLVRLCRVGKQHPLLSAEGNPDLPVRKGDIRFQGKVIFPL